MLQFLTKCFVVIAVQSSASAGTIKSGTAFWQRNKFTTCFSVLLQFKQQQNFSILFIFWVTSILEEVTLVPFLFFLSRFCFEHLTSKLSGESKWKQWTQRQISLWWQNGHLQRSVSSWGNRDCWRFSKVSFQDSLGAHDGFTQPILYKRFDRFILLIRQNALKKAVVRCDITEGITLGTKLKIPIFTLYLPHNLQNRILVFQKFMY